MSKTSLVARARCSAAGKLAGNSTLLAGLIQKEIRAKSRLLPSEQCQPCRAGCMDPSKGAAVLRGQ